MRSGADYSGDEYAAHCAYTQFGYDAWGGAPEGMTLGELAQHNAYLASTAHNAYLASTAAYEAANHETWTTGPYPVNYPMQPHPLNHHNNAVHPYSLGDDNDGRGGSEKELRNELQIQTNIPRRDDEQTTRNRLEEANFTPVLFGANFGDKRPKESRKNRAYVPMHIVDMEKLCYGCTLEPINQVKLSSGAVFCKGCFLVHCMNNKDGRIAKTYNAEFLSKHLKPEWLKVWRNWYWDKVTQGARLTNGEIPVEMELKIPNTICPVTGEVGVSYHRPEGATLDMEKASKLKVKQSHSWEQEAVVLKNWDVFCNGTLRSHHIIPDHLKELGMYGEDWSSYFLSDRHLNQCVFSVVEKSPEGWWYVVRKCDGKNGWVPGKYLEARPEPFLSTLRTPICALTWADVHEEEVQKFKDNYTRVRLNVLDDSCRSAITKADRNGPGYTGMECYSFEQSLDNEEARSRFGYALFPFITQTGVLIDYSIKSDTNQEDFLPADFDSRHAQLEHTRSNALKVVEQHLGTLRTSPSAYDTDVEKDGVQVAYGLEQLTLLVTESTPLEEMPQVTDTLTISAGEGNALTESDEQLALRLQLEEPGGKAFLSEHMGEDCEVQKNSPWFRSKTLVNDVLKKAGHSDKPTTPKKNELLNEHLEHVDRNREEWKDIFTHLGMENFSESILDKYIEFNMRSCSIMNNIMIRISRGVVGCVSQRRLLDKIVRAYDANETTSVWGSRVTKMTACFDDCMDRIDLFLNEKEKNFAPRFSFKRLQNIHDETYAVVETTKHTEHPDFILPPKDYDMVFSGEEKDAIEYVLRMYLTKSRKDFDVLMKLAKRQHKVGVRKDDCIPMRKRVFEVFVDVRDKYESMLQTFDAIALFLSNQENYKEGAKVVAKYSWGTLKRKNEKIGWAQKNDITLSMKLFDDLVLNHLIKEIINVKTHTEPLFPPISNDSSVPMTTTWSVPLGWTQTRDDSGKIYSIDADTGDIHVELSKAHIHTPPTQLVAFNANGDQIQ